MMRGLAVFLCAMAALPLAACGGGENGVRGHKFGGGSCRYLRLSFDANGAAHIMFPASAGGAERKVSAPYEIDGKRVVIKAPRGQILMKLREDGALDAGVGGICQRLD